MMMDQSSGIEMAILFLFLPKKDYIRKTVTTSASTKAVDIKPRSLSTFLEEKPFLLVEI